MCEQDSRYVNENVWKEAINCPFMYLRVAVSRCVKCIHVNM